MFDHHRFGRDFSLNPQRKFLLLLCLWRGLGHKLLHAKFQTCSFLSLAAGAAKVICPNVRNSRTKIRIIGLSVEWHCQGRPQGGQLGHFAPGPSLKGAPGGPLNTCLKDRYTLIEQSDLNTLIEQSRYSSEEQCSKLIDKEI